MAQPSNRSAQQSADYNFTNSLEEDDEDLERQNQEERDSDDLNQEEEEDDELVNNQQQMPPRSSAQNIQPRPNINQTQNQNQGGDLAAPSNWKRRNDAAPFNTITTISEPDMQLSTIRKKFPLSERMSLFINCCKSAKTLGPVKWLKNQPECFEYQDEYKGAKYQDYALKLKVKETGSLQLDPNMIHPFVRIHIINMETYKYLAKKDPAQPGTTQYESAQFMNDQKEFHSEHVDYLLPLSTKMFDMRIKGQNQATWNEEFIINELVSHIMQPKVVIMFEILECNPSLIMEKSKLLNAEMLYPVAWAYLRPLGTAQIHMKRSRLQLYKYKFKYDEDVVLNRPFDVRTPPVLLELNWPYREKYPSYLEIDLSFVSRSIETIERLHISRAPFEKEMPKFQLKYLEIIDKPSSVPVLDGNIKDVHRLKKWEKFLDQPSILPNLKVWKFDTDAQGAFKIRFSNKGKYLAIACTMQNSKTVIKIYDVEFGEIKVIMRGHYDLIHDLQWSNNDNFLVSSSADGSAKIWDTSLIEHDHADRLNYTENDDKYFWTALLHSSYVYAACFHPDESVQERKMILLATACFDQKIRLWLVMHDDHSQQVSQQCIRELSILEKPTKNLEGKHSIYEFNELDDETLAMIMRPEKTIQYTEEATKEVKTVTGSIFDQVHPNCMIFNDNGRLFVGDSKGVINVWDVSLVHNNIRCEDHFKIAHKELEGDQINHLIAHPDAQNQIFVQSRDNCVRLIEYESSRGIRIKKRFFGGQYKELMVKSTISPDGQFIVSGSETGKPSIWDATLEYTFKTKPYECKLLDVLADCDWNPRYNMFALSGFGQHFPVLVYVYQRSDEELNKLLYSGQGIQMGSEAAKIWLENKAKLMDGETMDNSFANETMLTSTKKKRLLSPSSSKGSFRNAPMY